MIRTNLSPWLCATAIVVCAASPLAQSIRGAVVGPDGAPCADAQIVVLQTHVAVHFARRALGDGVAGMLLLRGRTNARGNFSLDASRMVPGVGFSLWITSEAFADYRIDQVARPKTGETNLGKIVLKPGLAVTGRVRSADTKKPIAGALVRVLQPLVAISLATPGRESGWTAVTDAEGRFEIRNAPGPGTVRICAVAEGYSLAYTMTRLNQGQVFRHDFDLPPGRSVDGVIKDAKGQPVAGARVSAESRKLSLEMSKGLPPQPLHMTMADASGRFALHGLQPGDTYHLLVFAPGYNVKRDIELLPTEKKLTVQLQDSPKVRVKVAGKDGSRVRRYRVQLVHASAPCIFAGSAMLIVRDGIETLTSIPTGSYRLDIRAPGYAQQFSAEFMITSDTPAPIVAVKLDTGGVLEGQVVDTAGNPVAGVVVDPRIPFKYVMKTNVDHPDLATTTGAGGRYRIPLMRPGDYTVTFSHADYVEIIVSPVVISLHETMDQKKMVVHEGVRVFGSIKAAGGPRFGWRILVTELATGRKFDVTSDAEGRYQLPKRVLPGRLQMRVMVSPRPRKWIQRVVEVKAGKREQRFDIQIER